MTQLDFWFADIFKKYKSWFVNFYFCMIENAFGQSDCRILKTSLKEHEVTQPVF